ncbi:MAG: MgtC/SapB family protein [Anaerolineae bacterium]
MDILDTIVRILLAGVLGGLIGWEREARRKPAGLRTLMLVSIASCIFVTAATEASLRAGEALDAVRAMSGIAQGVGFLGAGVILQSHREVRWLTTAASLWAAAALGMAAGLGMYVTAVAGAAAVFVTLHWVVIIEGRFVRNGLRARSITEDEED